MAGIRLFCGRLGMTTCLFLCLFFSISSAVPTSTSENLPQCESAKYESKTRVFVSTDIGNEPDDQMSLVRLLTYANELDLVGIAASTSTFLNDTTNLVTIQTLVNAYDEVLGSLNANVPADGQYPSAQSLRDILSESHPVYGLATLNLTLSSAGESLINAVDSSDNELWFLGWGGTIVLAETLYHVQKERSKEELEKFISKLRVYTISDQDDSGPWIRVNFPSLFYITSIHAFTDFRLAAWSGISGEGLNGFDHGGPDSSLVSHEWLKENIQDQGTLGSHYPDYEFIMEGDTPSFLFLIPNGLNVPDHPEYGGWGGRYKLVDASNRYPLYSDTYDSVVGLNGQNFSSNQATIWRWRQGYQYDFAARMAWSNAGNTTGINHAPVAVVNSTCGPEFLEYHVPVGESITFDASQGWDPDGDAITYSWSAYNDITPNARTILRNGGKIVGLRPLNSDESIIEISPVLNTTAHVILTVSDNREKNLVSYRRILITSP